MNDQTKEWLDVNQSAAFLSALGIPASAPTLNQWRATGRQKIPFHRFGRLIRYRPEDLLMWAQSRRIDPAEIERHAKSNRLRANKS